MTYRLIGFMSIVLLLSLAAFALLMSHYQDQFMGEVARTASEVGRATLQTLESGPFPGPRPVVQRLGDSEAFSIEADRMVVDVEETQNRRVIFVTAHGEGELRKTTSGGFLMIQHEG